VNKSVKFEILESETYFYILLRWVNIRVNFAINAWFLAHIIFQMNRKIRCLGILLCWLFFAFGTKTMGADDPTGKLYDETIFVISNFSGVDANLSETLGIQ
jgi:hypothetical protein